MIKEGGKCMKNMNHDKKVKEHISEMIDFVAEFLSDNEISNSEILNDLFLVNFGIENFDKSKKEINKIFELHVVNLYRFYLLMKENKKHVKIKLKEIKTGKKYAYKNSNNDKPSYIA